MKRIRVELKWKKEDGKKGKRNDAVMGFFTPTILEKGICRSQEYTTAAGQKMGSPESDVDFKKAKRFNLLNVVFNNICEGFCATESVHRGESAMCRKRKGFGVYPSASNCVLGTVLAGWVLQREMFGERSSVKVWVLGRVRWWLPGER